jgi:MFS transporter, DHA1 family, multidrug resistance protein
MLRPDTLAMTLLLSVLTGIGPLTVDMYLASMPDIGRLLGATTAQVQLTISFYLIGFAMGQVLYGPLSDRHGRRPVMLGALTIYMVATLACALAPNIELLLAARFFQAIGGAGTVVLARAVVRDIYEGTRVGRELSIMATIMALAPIVAPLIGGVLQTFFGWRSNFVVLLGFGMGATAAVWLLLPETLRRSRYRSYPRCGRTEASSVTPPSSPISRSPPAPSSVCSLGSPSRRS